MPGQSTARVSAIRHAHHKSYVQFGCSCLLPAHLSGCVLHLRVSCSPIGCGGLHSCDPLHCRQFSPPSTSMHPHTCMCTNCELTWIATCCGAACLLVGTCCETAGVRETADVDVNNALSYARLAPLPASFGAWEAATAQHQRPAPPCMHLASSSRTTTACNITLQATQQ